MRPQVRKRVDRSTRQVGDVTVELQAPTFMLEQILTRHWRKRGKERATGSQATWGFAPENFSVLADSKQRCRAPQILPGSRCPK